MMENHLNTKSEALCLEQNLGYAAATPLKDQLLAKRTQNLVLDASKVDHLGASCLQVLLAAQATWREDRCAFEVSEMSNEFTQCLHRLGFSSTAFNQEGAA